MIHKADFFLVALAWTRQLPIRSNCSKNTRRLNLVKNSFLHFLHSTKFSRQRLNFPTKFTFRLNLLGRLNVDLVGTVIFLIANCNVDIANCNVDIANCNVDIANCNVDICGKNEHCKLQCGHCKLQCVHCTFSSWVKIYSATFRVNLLHDSIVNFTRASKLLGEYFYYNLILQVGHPKKQIATLRPVFQFRKLSFLTMSFSRLVISDSVPWRPPVTLHSYF